MKQLLQNMREGKTVIEDIPVPQVKPGTALVRISASLISAGTERMLVEFAEKSLVEKARSRPDLVKQVIDKAKREGILPTLQATFNRLDQPMALGYSSAGTIVAVGEGLKGFRVGDRVACSGGGHAVHAEYDLIPQNLLAKLPSVVDFESAAFCALGAIAMNGVRLANLQVGEKVVVIGLGLLGLITAQIANAAGCQVFGVDVDEQRVRFARLQGVHAVKRYEAEKAGKAFSVNQGFDAVLICADTPSNDTVVLAGMLARDRGHVISVGVVGLDLPRKPYYEKELTFQVSRSTGPGRYDLAYEEKGQDYPLGYVRWTEQRNMQSFLGLLAEKRVDVKPLITHRFPISEAEKAYRMITGNAKKDFLGVVLLYGSQKKQGKPETTIWLEKKPLKKELPGIGVLGAGNYALATFLPAIQKIGSTNLVGIVSGSGVSAGHAARKYHFSYASSDEEKVIKDPTVDIVVVLSRHHQHAAHVIKALQAGKNVYCEKPLVLNESELLQAERTLQRKEVGMLTVGFNRRFARFSQVLKERLAHRVEPMIVNYRVNAGFIPADHWLQDPEQGGGRLIGEGCHFIDYLTFLTGSLPVSVAGEYLPDNSKYNQDNFVLTFTYPDGSIGTISYLANGDKSLPKESIEVFCGGMVARLNDYRSLEIFKNGNHTMVKDPLKQDKGHANAWKTFLKAVKAGGKPPISYEEIIGVHRAVFAAREALRTKRRIEL